MHIYVRCILLSTSHQTASQYYLSTCPIQHFNKPAVLCPILMRFKCDVIRQKETKDTTRWCGARLGRSLVCKQTITPPVSRRFIGRKSYLSLAASNKVLYFLRVLGSAYDYIYLTLLFPF